MIRNTADSKKRIRIFKGTSSLDITGLISKTLDIDVYVYSNSDVFTCIKCYKSLIKYQRAEHHVKEIKNAWTQVSSIWQPISYCSIVGKGMLCLS